MIGIADINSAAGFLFLKVAFQAEDRASLSQHPRIDGTVRRVTADATLPQSFVLEDKRTALRGVTLEASLVLSEEQSSAAFNLLRPARSATFDRAADVRVVTIGATDFAFEHRMMMRQLEFRAHFKVTLETGVRRTSRIYDFAFLAAGRNVKTSRAMTSFAAHLLRIIARRF